MKDSLRLYGHYLSVHIRCVMQYKLSFLLTVIGQFLTAFGLFLTVYYILERFHEVDGFTFS